MRTVVPFRWRDLCGSVTVEVRVNDKPRLVGFDLLRLPFDWSLSAGFPVVEASVDYEGRGYAAVMGWIQLIRYGGGDLEGQFTEVDQPPQLSDAGTPYCYWGVKPRFFDAPAMDRRGVTWVAEAFLVASPDAVMTKAVRPLCGFRWGFATTTDPPALLPVEPTGPEAWPEARTVLRKRYPDWEFLPGPAGE
jgi:hypothetical protein